MFSGPRLKKLYLSFLILPLLSILLGTTSNQAVLIANHGKFPVMLNERQLEEISQPAPPQEPGWVVIVAHKAPVALKHVSIVRVSPGIYSVNGQFIDDVHSIMGPNSRLKMLADIWNLGGAIWSLGDFFIELGSFLLQYTIIIWLTLVLRQLYETALGRA